MSRAERVPRTADKLFRSLTAAQVLPLIEYLEALASDTSLPPKELRAMRLCANLTDRFKHSLAALAEETLPAQSSYHLWGAMFRAYGFSPCYPLHDWHYGVFGDHWEGERGAVRRTFCGILAARLRDDWGFPNHN